MSASAVKWWFELTEDSRISLLLDADSGDEGARESIVDVMDGLDTIAMISFMEWCNDVRGA